VHTFAFLALPVLCFCASFSHPTPSPPPSYLEGVGSALPLFTEFDATLRKKNFEGNKLW